MNLKHGAATVGDISCLACQQLIPPYVGMELTNEPANATYATVAFHIETCSTCETAYYREFHKQAQAKSVPELQLVGFTRGEPNIVKSVPSAAGSNADLTPSPDWQQVTTKYYHAWIDGVNQQWRQLQLFLADLTKPTTPSSSLALAGLQSTSPEPTSSAIGALETASTDADVEVMVAVEPDTTQDDTLCQIVVTVTLHGQFFGDFSGVVVTLLGGAAPQMLTTNDQGKVSFTGVSRSQLAAMSLVVKRPDQAD